MKVEFEYQSTVEATGFKLSKMRTLYEVSRDFVRVSPQLHVPTLMIDVVVFPLLKEDPNSVTIGIAGGAAAITVLNEIKSYFNMCLYRRTKDIINRNNWDDRFAVGEEFFCTKRAVTLAAKDMGYEDEAKEAYKLIHERNSSR